jgi:hypothetical protein
MNNVLELIFDEVSKNFYDFELKKKTLFGKTYCEKEIL